MPRRCWQRRVGKQLRGPAWPLHPRGGEADTLYQMKGEADKLNDQAEVRYFLPGPPGHRIELSASQSLRKAELHCTGRFRIIPGHKNT